MPLISVCYITGILAYCTACPTFTYFAVYRTSYSFHRTLPFASSVLRMTTNLHSLTSIPLVSINSCISFSIPFAFLVYIVPFAGYIHFCFSDCTCHPKLAYAGIGLVLRCVFALSYDVSTNSKSGDQHGRSTSHGRLKGFREILACMLVDTVQTS